MAETFPSTLAQKFLESGFQYLKGNTTVRSENEVGPAKVRQRFTKAINGFSGSIELDIDDFVTLETFYDTTLSGGSKTFMYDHPYTLVSTEFRFLKPYSISPTGGRFQRVSFEWEQIP